MDFGVAVQNFKYGQTGTPVTANEAASDSNLGGNAMIRPLTKGDVSSFFCFSITFFGGIFYGDHLLRHQTDRHRHAR